MKTTRRLVNFLIVMVCLLGFYFAHNGNPKTLTWQLEGFLLSLIPFMSLVFTHGITGIKEVFTGQKNEASEALQRRIVLVGILSFVLSTYLVLGTLNDTDKIGPVLDAWLSQISFLTLQCWFIHDSAKLA